MNKIWSFALILLFALTAPTLVTAQGFSPQVERQLADLKLEPSVQEAQKAALDFFNIGPETVNSLRSRAGYKAALPNIGARVRFGQNTADVDGFDFIQLPDSVASRDIAEGKLTEFEISASWDLSRLVFNSEVLDVSSLVVLQESVLKNVTRLFYTRRRLQVDLILNPPSDPATRISKELRIEELTSTLDAITGNLFTKRKGVR